MKLNVSHDREFGILWLYSEQPSSASTALGTDPNVVALLLNDESRQVIGLLIHGIGAYLPLGKLDYCVETDTLTFGCEIETATETEENEDLIGYWRPFENNSDGEMDAIAVSLRNASKHLTPLLREQAHPEEHQRAI